MRGTDATGGPHRTRLEVNVRDMDRLVGLDDPPEGALGLDLQRVDGAVVVRVSGELDLFTEQDFLDELARAFLLTEDIVVIDLAGCPFVSRTAVVAVEAAAGLLRRRGIRLLVQHPPPAFDRLVATVGSGGSLTVERRDHSAPECGTPRRRRTDVPADATSGTAQ